MFLFKEQVSAQDQAKSQCSFQGKHPFENRHFSAWQVFFQRGDLFVERVFEGQVSFDGSHPFHKKVHIKCHLLLQRRLSLSFEIKKHFSKDTLLFQSEFPFNNFNFKENMKFFQMTTSLSKSKWTIFGKSQLSFQRSCPFEYEGSFSISKGFFDAESFLFFWQCCTSFSAHLLSENIGKRNAFSSFFNQLLPLQEIDISYLQKVFFK